MIKFPIALTTTAFAALILFKAAQCVGQTNQSQIAPAQVTFAGNSVKSVGTTQLSPGDRAAWASAIASVINLILVVWLFVWSNRKHRDDRRADFENLELERKARVAGFWIEELIIRPNHDFLHKFFDSYEVRLKNANAVTCENVEQLLNKASEEVAHFKGEYTQLYCRVYEPLSWVNAEFSKLLPILGNIEDLVTQELTKMPGIHGNDQVTNQNKKPPNERLGDLRRDFFKTIHELHKSASCPLRTAPRQSHTVLAEPKFNR